MVTQTFERILALFSLCILRLSALTPVSVVQGFGSVLRIFVGVAIPLPDCRRSLRRSQQEIRRHQAE
jgi:hypothetical protein